MFGFLKKKLKDAVNKFSQDVEEEVEPVEEKSEELSKEEPEKQQEEKTKTKKEEPEKVKEESKPEQSDKELEELPEEDLQDLEDLEEDLEDIKEEKGFFSKLKDSFASAKISDEEKKELEAKEDQDLEKLEELEEKKLKKLEKIDHLKQKEKQLEEEKKKAEEEKQAKEEEKDRIKADQEKRAEEERVRLDELRQKAEEEKKKHESQTKDKVRLREERLKKLREEQDKEYARIKELRAEENKKLEEEKKRQQEELVKKAEEKRIKEIEEKREQEEEELQEIQEEEKKVVEDLKEVEQKKGFFGRLFSKKEEEETVEETDEDKRVTEEVKEVEKPVVEEKKEKPVEEPEEKKSFFTKLTEVVTKKSISESKFEELFWDLEVALLENNVAVEVIDLIKENLKKELVDTKVLRGKINDVIIESLKDSINQVFDVEQIDLLHKLNEKKPLIISFVGVNGSGKTTTIAKMIKFLQDNDKTCVVAASDTFRAAAIQQLEEHTKRLGVKIIKHDYGADPAAVAYDAIKYGEAKRLDCVLIDTAGRLHSNSNLMDEMKKIMRVAKPDLKIFIGEAITGNDCVEQAKQFNEAVGIDGIILAKADIDDKGGAALSVSYITKKPILYLGTGQEYKDLEVFDKEKIVKQIGL